MSDAKRWIWQEKDYPNFQWDAQQIEPLVQLISRKQGELTALSRFLGSGYLIENQLQTLVEEVFSSSAIEGEMLNRSSVKSSLRQQLGIDTVRHFVPKDRENSAVEILMEATSHYDAPLTVEMLHGWHTKLFEADTRRLWPIEAGAFRSQGTMQVVAGVVGKEQVFYEAPDSRDVPNLMNEYVAWYNATPDTLTKAAIAHVWFVIIHPYEDGNGRIARAVTERVLSAVERATAPRLYSLSRSIYTRRKGYYRALEMTTGYVERTDLMEVTPWCVWFLETLRHALDESIASMGYVLDKAHFWDRHRDTLLNERQRKALNALLDRPRQGSLTTKKYTKITGTSPATASRDIQSLVEKGCIVQEEGTAGRNVRYRIVGSTDRKEEYMIDHDSKQDGEWTPDQIGLIEQLTTEEIQTIEDTLLSNIGERWKKVAMVVAESMMDLLGKIEGIPDSYYLKHVQKLVENGVIESQGNLARMRHSEVRKLVYSNQ